MTHTTRLSWVLGCCVALTVAGTLLLSDAFAGPTNETERGSVASLPADIRNAMERAAHVYKEPLRGARWSKVRVLGTDHPIYQLQGTNGRGNRIEIEVTSAGRIIEVEEHGIPVDEVPGDVMQALKARMPEFQPTQIEAIYQTEKEQPVSYGFEGPDAGDGTVEVYISADGKTLLNRKE